MKCCTAPYLFSMEARQRKQQGHDQAAAPESGAKWLTMEWQHPRAVKVQQAFRRRHYSLPRKRTGSTFVAKRWAVRYRNPLAIDRLPCRRHKERWQARVHPKW